MKTVLTKKELAERWGVNTKTIDVMEEEGTVKRLPKLPGVKYSLTSIEALEYDGTDNLILKKERKIKELEAEVLRYRNKFEEIRGLLG